MQRAFHVGKTIFEVVIWLQICRIKVDVVLRSLMSVFYTACLEINILTMAKKV